MKKGELRSTLARMGLCLYLVLSTVGLAPAAAARPPSDANQPQSAPVAPEMDVSRAPDEIVARSFSMTLPCLADSWISEGLPTENYGAADSLSVGESEYLSSEAIALVYFNLDALPAGSQVVSATLLLAPANLQTAPFFFQPEAIISSWSEYGVTWATRPNAAHVGDPIVQYDPLAINEINVTNILLAWQLGWYGNYGIQIRATADNVGFREFHARSTDSPPQLVVYYTMKETLIATQDTWVDESRPLTNYGSSSALNVSRTALGDDWHTLVEFDLSGLPENAAMTRATLRMYSEFNRLPDGDQAQGTTEPSLVDELMVDAIVADWDEMTATWQNRPPSQYMDDPAATYDGNNNWTDLDVTKIAQGWTSGLVEPHGILVRVAPSIPSGLFPFQSRSTARPPQLIIEYGEAPPVCNPITGVTVNGATEGITHTVYNFVAQTSPPDADPADEITWVATDQLSPDQGTIAQMVWDHAGVKNITVTVEHCGGTTMGYHTITIQEPPAGCEEPITNFAIQGPTLAALGQETRFEGRSSPLDLTTPVTYTYDATGQRFEMTVSNSYTQAVLYTWDRLGTKAITMTAENCGGALVAHHTVEVLRASDLPDLAITSAWLDVQAGKVWYVIANQGQTTAPAGHRVAVLRDGVQVAWKTINEPLAPGAVRAWSITHSWSCAGDTAQVELVADSLQQIPEVNESNNTWSDTWACDQSVPTFVNGPQVTDTWEDSADLYWRTSEPTTCRVEYGTQAYIAPDSQLDPHLTALHNFTLVGLAADTVYHARVYCEDPAGNGVLSEDFLFETQPPLTDPPDFSDLRLLVYPSTLYNFYEIRATLPAAELPGTSHVEFYLDGEGVGLDYWPEVPPGRDPYYSAFISPHALGFTWDEFFQQHTIRAVGVSSSGRESTLTKFVTPGEPPRKVELDILYPSENGSLFFETLPVWEQVNVQVYAAQFEWNCTWSGFSEGLPPGLDPVKCDDVERDVSHVTVYVDGQPSGVFFPAAGETLFPVQTSFAGLDVGPHTLRAVAVTDDILPTEISQNFFLQHGERSIDVQRTVTREDHYLRVTLMLTNDGNFEERIEVIEDSLLGLQPLPNEDPNGLGTVWEWNLVNDDGHANVESVIRFYPAPGGASALVLAPGESFSFDYLAVPILRHEEVGVTIGHRPVQVYAYRAGVLQPFAYDRPATGVYDPAVGPVSLQQAVLNAAGQADYLIVTHPLRVMDQYGSTTPNQMSQLLQNMGKLAYLKNGVMGFVTEYEKEVLDNLVEPDGAWAEAMHPDFQETDKGFLLIVGETEVVPAYYIGPDSFDLDDDHDDYGVRDSDLVYANTAGQTHRPELVVGRMLGDGPVELANNLENVINSYLQLPGYGFDRSHAFIMSGWGNDNSTFYHAANRAYGVWWPQTEDLPYLIHAREWTSSTLLWQEIKPNLADRDIILWFGHGNVDRFTPFTTDRVDDASFSLGNSTPVVMAASCLTGNYEAPSDDYGIAEAFLNKGAGVYIGSTEISFSRANNAAFRRFSEYWNEWESAGVVLNHVKRAIWDKDGWYESFSYWAFEQNLYGDPKHGMLEGVWTPPDSDGLRGVDSVEQVEGLTKFTVTVPEPRLTRVDDYVEVEIPGGLTLVEFGAYEVPLWTVSLEFRPGDRVQNVRLLSRDDPLALHNLNLAVVDTTTSTLNAPRAALPAEVTGWYPALDRVFDWSLEEQADGSTRLEIVIYPFYYNSGNGDAIYHQRHAFEIETIQTAVKIKDLRVEEAGI